MKTTEETAAELLSEWKLLEDHVISHRRDEISRLLDEMCEAAGIYYVAHGEYFRYGRFSFDYIGSGRDARKLATIDTVTAREQQALQEWLLIKEGK